MRSDTKQLHTQTQDCDDKPEPCKRRVLPNHDND
jgi:hypothetical protein